MNTKKEVLRRYAQHSPLSHPGKQDHLLAQLPKDVETLCELVRNPLFHYLEGDMYEVYVSNERTKKDAARTVERMLQKIVELNNQPVTVVRAFEKRLVGCCRDYALLLCAMLRQQGVPARVRYGWSLYFSADFAFDHVVTEYWSADRKKWCLVDAQQDAKHVEMNQLQFDPHDIPGDWFLSASRAWQLARGGLTKADKFGYSPEAKGLWVLQHYLLLDLASLNKREMLIGDAWGLKDVGPDMTSDEDLMFLDDVALALQSPDDLDAVTKLYQDDRLNIPAVINHYPLYDPWQAETVNLRFIG